MNKYLPVFIKTENQPCLVVGGGEVALRKVKQLLSAHAEVHVQAPGLCAGMLELEQQEKIIYHKSKFSEDSLTNYILVIAATDDTNINQNVSKIAKNLKIPVNVVDNRDLCSFIMPSVVNRDPVQIAISTGGASPVLARLLRARLETLIPAAYGHLAVLMKDFRQKVKDRFPETRQRRRFWEGILQGPIAEMLFAGREQAAKQALELQLSASGEKITEQGEVYLVGGGPGDPDLLTFRALRLMQQADVVLYDRLVSPALLSLVRKDAEQVFVGKASDRHAVSQDDINRLLIEYSKQGKRVLRLKGGDPFIFGRGGEEIETLSEQGIAFQVVPGITAAGGCSTYAGIPLTHRDYAQACIFVTGHIKDGELALNWQTLVQPRQTIAVYMGVKGMDVLAEKLVEHGMSGSMPAAVIQRGTTPEQRVFIATVETLTDVIRDQDIQPPSMVIIGEVVLLHEKLDWYKPVRSKE